MNIKFDNINDYSWVKYSNYDMKEINGKTYIYASSDANLLPCVLKGTIDDIVINLINLGQLAQNENQNIYIKILEFINQYGLLGIEQKDNYGHVLNVTLDAVHSKTYKENIEDIISYAKKTYNFVLKAVTENKVEGDTTSFEIDNIKFVFTEDRVIKINFETFTLQEIIVFNLATLVNSEHIKIKFCKHCKNAFIVKNPKAEYCNPQCKNQANVYKSRAKNKN